MARIFLEVMPNVDYILIDIPTSLIMASFYLSDSCKEKLDNAKFCLPKDIEHIEHGKVDLFININSFGEMTPEIVSSYLNHIRRV